MARTSGGVGRGTSIVTERLLLRPPVPGDASDFCRLSRSSRRLHRHWATPPRTEADFRKYVERARQPEVASFLIVRRGDGALVGAATLSQIFLGPFKNTYLGYWVGREYARQGYMLEALKAVLQHAFQRLKLHRVEANIQPDNAASRALLIKLGFRQEGFSPRYLKVAGRWRDHERWALLREEWAS